MRSPSVPLLLLGFVAAIAAPGSRAAAAGSDDLASATAITSPAPGVVATDSGDNTAATGEPGEQIPTCTAGDSQINSVWYSWTLSTSQSVTIDTFGSAFDTVLIVYTGTTIGNLTPVVCNDDTNGLQSRVILDATGGETYLIRIDGYDDATGPYVVNWQVGAVAPNDDLVDATPLFGPFGAVVTGWNTAATGEPGEQLPSCAPTDAQINSVWFSWWAPADGQAVVDTVGSSFDTVLTVYNGTTIGALTEVACNDDGAGSGTASALDFPAALGEEFVIRLDGNQAAAGEYQLNLLFASNPPPNDDLDAATMLAGDSGTTFGWNIGATGQTGEPSPTCVAADPQINSVWFWWTAAADGDLTVDTLTSTFDTVLAAFELPPIGPPVEVACNDDAAPEVHQSEMTFAVDTGTSYLILLDGFEFDIGTYALTHLFTPGGTPMCDGLPVTVDIGLGQTPTTGDDVILGTTGDDVIDALDGDDTICGLAGDDVIDGGLGLDTIFGDNGIDTIDGGRGNDYIFGGADPDDIYGGGGGDRLFGEAGADAIRGGNGNDVIEGGPGADELRGQNGRDTVYANSVVDFSTTDIDIVYGGGLYDDVFGDAGDDTVYGGNFADVLSGKAGDDNLYGNNGADTLRGGPHNTGDYCNGGTINSGSGDTATACETVINIP